VEDGGKLKLLAPNRFVVDWVQTHCLRDIRQWWERQGREAAEVVLEVGTRAEPRRAPIATETEPRPAATIVGSRLNPTFTFENFVEGKSNQLARAAALQVAKHPGSAYNPL